MNKILIGIFVMAFSVMSVGSAQATFFGSTTNSGKIQDNEVTAIAVSGHNNQDATNITKAKTNTLVGLGGSSNATALSNQTQLMFTGNAIAGASQVNMINSGCPCDGNSTTIFGSTTNKGKIQDNEVTAIAVSGHNNQDATNITKAKTNTVIGLGTGSNATSVGLQDQEMQTGNSRANAQQWNLVNSSVIPL